MMQRDRTKAGRGGVRRGRAGHAAAAAPGDQTAAALARAMRLSLAPRPQAPVVVVTLCKDRLDVVQSFVSQQLALGARQVCVYFDDPADPAIAWTAAQQGARAIPCDEDFWAAARWKGRGGRPDHIEARQSACYNHAYAAFGPEDWIGFCDIDELFVPHGGGFAEMLAAIPPGTEQILAPVAEAFWLPQTEGRGLKTAPVARRPVWSPRAQKEMLRRCSALFATFSDAGVMGHIWGKSIARGGLAGFSARIHRHRRSGPGKGEQLVPATGAVTLLHYDALSFDLWEAKHLRRLARETRIGGNPDRRNAQSELLGLCTDAAGRRVLFDHFYGSTPGYLDYLAGHGRLVLLTDIPPAAP